MFITTANTLDIPPALMDCMEIIRIAGYSEDEKVEIARKHLIPHAIAKHGLKDREWAISDEALRLLIRRYTREAGVRNLERELASLIRKAVKELTLHNKQSITVEANALADYLGVPKFRSLGILDDGDLRQVGQRTDRTGRRAVTLSAAPQP
jgi:ATP-dependent Lon protease